MRRFSRMLFLSVSVMVMTSGCSHYLSGADQAKAKTKAVISEPVFLQNVDLPDYPSGLETLERAMMSGEREYFNNY